MELLVITQALMIDQLVQMTMTAVTMIKTMSWNFLIAVTARVTLKSGTELRASNATHSGMLGGSFISYALPTSIGLAFKS